MGHAAEELKKATADVLAQVIQTAAAQAAADQARAEAAPNLFALAQAHRHAERRCHEMLDATIKAALAAINAGDINLGVVPKP